jgi:hypothetical protein
MSVPPGNLHLLYQMKLEQFPIVLGVLVCLIAAGIIYDAVSPEKIRPFRERRRRRRAEVLRSGELLAGLGTLCMGAALIGRDTWRWVTIVVFAGVLLIVAGGVINRKYIRELLFFRGAARRGQDGEGPPPPAPEPPMRIR